MGMSASQARLLSITARLSNNEMEQQSIAYSKQRLADNSEQANNAYLEALNKTKYQVLTGYNNSQANYADVTYAQLTGVNTVATGKQYLVKDKKGKVLVSEKIAQAFEKNNGDFNKFLRDLGYTQANIDLDDTKGAEEAIHNAWDNYLVSVGMGIYDENGDTPYSLTYNGHHILNFGYTSFSDDEAYDGYPTYNYKDDSSEETAGPIALNYEGTTVKQRELYDYALSITGAYYNKNKNSMSALKYDAQIVSYYKNIFNEMRTCGYTTLKESFAQKLATTTSTDGMTSESKIFNDSQWMVKQLKAGNLVLSFYSAAEKGFIGTTLDDDESICEKEDSSAIVIAEQVYKNQMDKIESQDKQFDLQLNKLESEHNALQTEYDSVKKVISNNVEKSFNTFSA